MKRDADVQEQLYRAVFEGARDALLLVGDDGSIVQANSAASELFGVATDDLLGRALADFAAAPEFDAGATRAQLHQRGQLRGEFPIRRPDGSRRELEFNATAHIAPGLHLSVLRDVTPQRRAERALEQSEARLRALLERSIETVTLADETGALFYVSPTAGRVGGYEPDEILGCKLFDQAHPDDRPRLLQLAAELRGQPGASICAEFRALHADGHYAWFEMTLTNLLAEPAVRALVGNFRNIDAHKRSGEELRKSRHFLELAQSLAQVGTWYGGMDPEDLLVFSRECCRIIGLPEGARRTRGGFLELVHPEERAHIAGLMAQARTTRAPVEVDFRVVRPDGEVRWLHGRAAYECDQADGLPYVIGALRDITEQRLAENQLRRTEDKLRQAQRMEAVGRLAGGIAHDFNNLLSVVIGYTSSMLEIMPLHDPHRADVEQVLLAGEKAVTLTRQLLAFSRQQVLQPVPLDLNRTVHGLEPMLRRLIRADIELSVALKRPLGRVSADPGQLEQVIMNLVVNARDAMPSGGKLSVKTDNVVLDAVAAEALGGAKPGRYVTLAVFDTGIGIEESDRERIFEPFFTTKEIGKGTGLGLSTVFGIVQQSGGHIAVESTRGSGSVFRVYLPEADGAEATSSPAALEPVEVRGSETILLVEDEEAVRVLTRTVLQRQGYAVLEAQNAGEAFLISEQHAGPIHLLLTDVVLPRVGGQELAQRLLRLRPELRVLFMSGYPGESFPRDTLSNSSSFIQKPITPEALGRKVRMVLDAQSWPPRSQPAGAV